MTAYSECRLVSESGGCVPRLDLESDNGFHLAIVFPASSKERLEDIFNRQRYLSTINMQSISNTARTFHGYRSLPEWANIVHYEDARLAPIQRNSNFHAHRIYQGYAGHRRDRRR